MKRRTVIILLMAWVGLSATMALAEDTTLRATLGANAYGRKLEVKVNDTPIPQLSGGGAQAYQLFHEEHANRSEVPEDYLHLFCLREGENKIEIVYSTVEGETPGTFDVYIKMGGYSVLVLKAERSGDDVSGEISGTFEIYATEPEGFETTVL